MMAKGKAKYTPKGKTAAANQLPLLQQRLILNRFFCRQLGFEDFKALREKLRDHKEGWSEDGHSHFYHTLQGLQGLLIPPDQLATYDLNIKGYVERLNRFRTPPVQLKYFQYLAVLFTEIYLDRLFNDREGLLAELNAFVAQTVSLRPATQTNSLRYNDADLSKIAFWMATGSGKTLIMHVNLWQILRHVAQSVRLRDTAQTNSLRYDNVLLITPNEGLSRQHLEEFRKSGIAARHHSEGAGSHGGLPLQGDAPVTVIEITKLTETKRGGGLSVEVDAFGPNNLLFVDEGHRGASGDVWRALRAKVAENGFTFEYSATFGQIVNGASPDRRPALLEEYSKAILFDYSYPHFYHDGYGKDYHILNLKDERAATGGSPYTDWMLLGNLLSFYEQCLAYEENREAFRPYDIEPPLWVFVGHSVTGGKTKEDQETLTDVEEIIAFFAKFLSDRATWTARIDKALKGETGLKNQRDEDLFRDLFPYLKGKSLQPSQIYDDIVQRVFHAQAGQQLRAVELKAVAGEIGLRAGADNRPFGVINIGDVSGLMSLLGEQGIPCESENISGSLFDAIKAPDSPMNILIGSRKFMEGWDSFRVASMGLLNIGRGEGSQIIQLFGRGVRLWGKDRSLKRSRIVGAGLKPAPTSDGAPSHIGLLETLNVFGVRANYMAQFREYLKQEGIETDFEEITVPVRVQDEFLTRGLQVLRLPSGETFQEKDGVVLIVDGNIKVTLDLRPQVEMARSGADEEVMEKAGGENKAATLKQLTPLLNWERIYFDLLDFKRAKGFHNLSFTESTLRAIVTQGNYTVLCPDGHLPPQSFRDLRRTEDIATGVLRKYVAAFYDRQRRAWEREHLRLQPLTDKDPNLTFGGYTVRAKPDFAETVRELVKEADKLYKQDVTGFPNIHFDRHLYQPLMVTDKQERMESTPPALNEGEAQFVRDLRGFLQKNSGQFEGKEIFLLRNLTRGRGIGFFEASDSAAFYPDFILWVIEACPERSRRNGKQWITFIDPHGLRNTEGLDDPKVQLHKRLKDDEPQLQAQCPDWMVHLTSFIVAPSSYEELAKTSWVRDHTKGEFEQAHVLFQEDADYVQRIVASLSG